MDNMNTKMVAAAVSLREALLSDVRDCTTMPLEEQRQLRNLCSDLKWFIITSGRHAPTGTPETIIKRYLSLRKRLRHYISTQRVEMGGRSGMTRMGILASGILSFITMSQEDIEKEQSNERRNP